MDKLNKDLIKTAVVVILIIGAVVLYEKDKTIFKEIGLALLEVEQVDQTVQPQQTDEVSTELETHRSDKFKFSFQYPKGGGWEVTKSKSEKEELLTFFYPNNDLKGPIKSATMYLSARNYEIPIEDVSKELESEVRYLISLLDYGDHLKLLTRNVQIPIQATLQKAKAEVLQTQEIENFNNGMIVETENLYIVAVNDNYHYKFNFSTNKEDFSDLYPIAIQIMQSIRFE